MTRQLYVDAADIETGLFEGTEPNDPTACAPFVVFDSDTQDNIAGPFNTYDEAEQHRLAILAGAEPQINVARLQRWIQRIDEEIGKGALTPAEVAKLFI